MYLAVSLSFWLIVFALSKIKHFWCIVSPTEVGYLLVKCWNTSLVHAHRGLFILSSMPSCFFFVHVPQRYAANRRVVLTYPISSNQFLIYSLWWIPPSIPFFCHSFTWRSTIAYFFLLSIDYGDCWKIKKRQGKKAGVVHTTILAILLMTHKRPYGLFSFI